MDCQGGNDEKSTCYPQFAEAFSHCGGGFLRSLLRSLPHRGRKQTAPRLSEREGWFDLRKGAALMPQVIPVACEALLREKNGAIHWLGHPFDKMAETVKRLNEGVASEVDLIALSTVPVIDEDAPDHPMLEIRYTNEGNQR
jgi:hypothetical protein